MIDAPDRPEPRFPASSVPRVTAGIRDALDGWGVGPGTTVVTGGARGADLIAAEEALSRGASVRLVLALPPEDFERESVVLPGTDWVARFRAVRDAADVSVIPASPGGDVFARTNARIIDEARALDPSPRALLVWDGREGDGPGGTSDFARAFGGGDRVRVIDPSPQAPPPA